MAMPRPRMISALLIASLSLLGCGAPAPTPPAPIATVQPAPDPCRIAGHQREKAATQARAGRVWSAAALYRDADKACPAKTVEELRARADVLAHVGAFAEARGALALAGTALGPEERANIQTRLDDAEKAFRALDPHATANQGIDAQRKGNDAEGRRLLSRALARAELDAKAKLELTLFTTLMASRSASDQIDVTWTQDHRIIVAHHDRITVFDAERARVMEEFEVAEALSISPDGRWLAHRAPQDFALFDVNKRAPGPALQKGKLKDCWPSCLSFSPDSSLIAGTCTEPSGIFHVVVWRAATGEITAHLPKVVGQNAIVFSPSGALLAGADNSGGFAVWDFAAKKRILSREGLTAEERRTLKLDATDLMGRGLGGMAFSHDETEVLWTSGGTVLKQTIPRRKPSERRPSPDGVVVMKGCFGDFLHDEKTGKIIAEMQPPQRPRIATDPKGERYAVAWGGMLDIVSRNKPSVHLTKDLRSREVPYIERSTDAFEIIVGNGSGHGTAWPTGRKVPPPPGWGPTYQRRASDEEKAELTRAGVVIEPQKVRVGNDVIACESLAQAFMLPERNLLALNCYHWVGFYDVRPGVAAQDRLRGWMKQYWDGALVTGFVPDVYLHVQSSDGRLELFGSHTPLSKRLVCKVDRYVFPFEACEDRVLTPGLLAEILRGDTSK